MNGAVFFSVLFALFALAMLFSGFWSREELSPEWRQAKAIGFVLIGIGGLLGLVGALGHDVSAATGGFWIVVSLYGLATYGSDLRPKQAADRFSERGAAGDGASNAPVRATRWEGRVWGLWVPTTVAIAAMAAGLAFALLR